MGRRNGYIATLDGWRALAVVGVILYHGRNAFFAGDSLLLKLASRGNIGVDLFFSISGFLICGLLLKEHGRDGSISLRRFYLQRCFRILPAYYAALAAICMLGILGAIPVNFQDLPSCLLFFRNYKPLGIDEQGGFYTAHYWSLAIEEHFYLIWPILLVAVRPQRVGRVTLWLAIAIFSWRTAEFRFHLLSGVLPQNLLTARTDTRLDGLLWGCLAAIYFPQIKSSVEAIRFRQLWIPILLTLVVLEAIHCPQPLLWHAILLPVLVLSTVLQPDSWLAQALEWKILRWIGSLSYGLYLWQELFLPQSTSELGIGWVSHLQSWPWNVMAIVACACLSRYLIEQPMIDLGHRLNQPSGKSYAAGKRRLRAIPYHVGGAHQGL